MSIPNTDRALPALVVVNILMPQTLTVAYATLGRSRTLIVRVAMIVPQVDMRWLVMTDLVRNARMVPIAQWCHRNAFHACPGCTVMLIYPKGLRHIAANALLGNTPVVPVSSGR